MRPEYVGRGIGALIAAQTESAARRLGYTRLDLSLVQEANQNSRRIIEAFGCHPYKTFRLYHKHLVRTVPTLDRSNGRSTRLLVSTTAPRVRRSPLRRAEAAR